MRFSVAKCGINSETASTVFDRPAFLRHIPVSLILSYGLRLGLGLDAPQRIHCQRRLLFYAWNF